MMMGATRETVCLLIQRAGAQLECKKWPIGLSDAKRENWSNGCSCLSAEVIQSSTKKEPKDSKVLSGWIRELNQNRRKCRMIRMLTLLQMLD